MRKFILATTIIVLQAASAHADEIMPLKTYDTVITHQQQQEKLAANAAIPNGGLMKLNFGM